MCAKATRCADSTLASTPLAEPSPRRYGYGYLYCSPCRIGGCSLSFPGRLVSYGEGRGPVYSPGSLEPEHEAGPAAMPPPHGYSIYIRRGMQGSTPRLTSDYRGPRWARARAVDRRRPETNAIHTGWARSARAPQCREAGSQHAAAATPSVRFDCALRSPHFYLLRSCRTWLDGWRL